jgi:hypothetical protein
LIPPVQEKLYTIANNTTGGFAIRVIGVSGTGVNIPNGATCLVYCDGTNFINGLSGSTGNFTVNGTLSTTGALTYGGVTLANSVTGTGSMVLSASPTFTGVPIAPTASPGTNTTQIATTAFALANGIPSGAILLWSGAIGSIPSGWLICDGTNGTPDLRNRFVVGAGSTYAVAATGGTADSIVVSHNHTASSAVVDPGHAHNLDLYFFDTGGNRNFARSSDPVNPTGPVATNTASTGISVNTTINSAGSSGTNANLPPYYALAYIMKS